MEVRCSQHDHDQLVRGDTSLFTHQEVVVFWSKFARHCSVLASKMELQALFEFMVNEKKGLPSFLMTGSCAKFYFSPLRRLLEQYILQTTGKEVNLAEDINSQGCAREYPCCSKLL